MKFMLRSLLGLAVVPLAVFATVAKIEADVGDINTKVANLNTQVQNFNGSITGAVGIHTGAQNINTAIQKATDDTIATPGSFSAADSQVLLALVETLRDNVIVLDKSLVAKKPVIQAVPLGTQAVLADVRQLNATTVRFEGVLVPKTPPGAASQAAALVAAINKAFADVIAAYST